MKHAEKLIGRILFLGGKPIVSDLKAIHIGDEVPKQIDNDRLAEVDAIKAYNDAIVLAGEVRLRYSGYTHADSNDEDQHLMN